MCSFPTGGRRFPLHQRGKQVCETCIVCRWHYIDLIKVGDESEYKGLVDQVEVTTDFRRSPSQSSMEQCLVWIHPSSWDPQSPWNSNIDLVRKKAQQRWYFLSAGEVFSGCLPDLPNGHLLYNTAISSVNVRMYIYMYFSIFLVFSLHHSQISRMFTQTWQENSIIILFQMRWNTLSRVSQSETPTLTLAKQKGNEHQASLETDTSSHTQTYLWHKPLGRTWMKSCAEV